ncbi:hypothetical protein [Pelobacter propionicus]|uniref:tRNA(Ile2) 2-agmatinylcytidine synthetase n=1 Tax=Pelobacter propionicus (strain DSM 2379 / NBRC 103807 / OttBd1) TaxID=338966 RepID=A1AP77_PELPD|nr:hypothetical protein [Pelobacter propionicus]ABK99147.1 tRNA(Ile2) 2-agmatinylcytidine synthetase [Pelobacter propionicus DSM 2379]
MRILVSIDDTDNLESRGTGELASLIADDLETNGWGTSSFVSRHQLLVHPDIPYTSHNSAMCFSAEIDDSSLDRVIGHASAFLSRESAPDSDPGLCVAVLDRLSSPDRLIAFGRQAKQAVLSKEMAYETARCEGVHLSEHGGSGQGVIGALAGAGLRLSGNDGRMKGGLKIPADNGVISVAALISSFAEVDVVRSVTGEAVGNNDLVRIDEKAKTVLLDGLSVLLVTPSPDGTVTWQTVHRKQLKRY